MRRASIIRRWTEISWLRHLARGRQRRLAKSPSVAAAEVLEDRALLSGISFAAGRSIASSDQGEFHAIVLAAAGLKRLGLGERITGRLSYEECLPAVGQGAIGIECREDKEEVLAALKLVEHEGTRRCVDAERSFAATLKASCESPVAAYGEIREGELYLRGMVATPDGSELLRREVRGSQTDARRLGSDLARGLLADGAGTLLESLKTES